LAISSDREVFEELLEGLEEKGYQVIISGGDWELVYPLEGESGRFSDYKEKFDKDPIEILGVGTSMIVGPIWTAYERLGRPDKFIILTDGAVGWPLEKNR